MPGLMNWELVEQLAAVFQKRYECQFAWANALSAFSLLPGLRGFWPMSSSSETGAAYDLSGQGRTLTYNGSPVFAFTNLAPRVAYIAGTSDYHSRADEAGLDILGTEATIGASIRGLTIGGWFFPSAPSSGADTGLMSKWVTAANQRSYLLRKPAADTVYFAVSIDGIATVAVNVSAVAINAWSFIAARFTPSTELATFTNGVKATNLVGVPASIFNSNSAFEIGRYNAANYYTGSASLCFLCASALSDAIINQLFEQTRALFGA